LVSETRDPGLPDGENRMILRLLVWTQYQGVTDRRTDNQTRRSSLVCAVHRCVNAAARKNVHEVLIYFTASRERLHLMPYNEIKQEAQLSQRDRAMLRVIEYFDIQP